MNRAARTTGRYVRQMEGYNAFIPEALPPAPPVRIDGEMQVLLSRADRALGRLDGSIQTLPNPELFIFMYVRKEAVLSSQIEGTQASINDVLEVEAQIFDPERPNDVGEVLNYVNAMNYGLQRQETLPMSLRLIREIHKLLMQGVRGNQLNPGEFRESQNWIGVMGGTISDASFVPPPPSQLMDVLGDFERFLHADVDIPALIRIGLMHAQFETIHPFLDGNGRVGRLLITFLLCQQEILSKPVLYLSHYFKKHRQRYYELLQGTRDNGDWESWLKFFLEGVAEVSNEATQTARKIVDMREDHRRLIIQRLGRVAGNGINVLEHLFEQPIVQVNKVAELLGVTYQSANALMAKFEEEGLVREITGHVRNRRFSYTSYISLFSDV
ncbi:MAG: Fic family protein [Proteobacteria bacterium]|nr:Fic family protein [Pseudomonadota bacterium]